MKYNAFSSCSQSGAEKSVSRDIKEKTEREYNKKIKYLSKVSNEATVSEALRSDTVV